MSGRHTYEALLEEAFETSLPLPTLTDGQIEEFITQVAETGMLEDEHGATVPVLPLYRAIAEQWIRDKAAIPGNIGPEFWHWAKLAAYLAMFGFPSNTGNSI